MNLWEMILTALQDQGALVLRLAVACLCGGAIGIERTLRQKDAGFRTHVIVALGAALMMVISKYGFVDVVGNGITSDAGRIASNIVTGISFLCAGMIVKGATIKGLTTAAGIWVTSAVGMAIGCGMYLTGVLATIGYDKVLANDNTAELLVRIKNSPEAVAHLREQLAERRIEIVSTKINADADIYLNLAMNVRMHDPAGLEKVVAILQENEDIQAISL